MPVKNEKVLITYDCGELNMSDKFFFILKYSINMKHDLENKRVGRQNPVHKSVSWLPFYGYSAELSRDRIYREAALGPTCVLKTWL